MKQISKRLLSLLLVLVMVCTMLPTAVFAEEAAVPQATGNVAKVGNTEYATIDEAIAAWTDGTTLTLLADVTLSDVITLKSTEYHILDLGTYTMTAASGKDAIQYVVNGRSSASYALDIKADATNPGGITATGKTIVSHIKPSSGAPSKDRPITRFYGGVFNASYVVKQGATNSWGFLTSGYTGASAPYFQFYGGEYNGTIYTNRSQNQFYGGTFNGSMQMSVDSSAYTLVAGGTFKNLSNSFGSTLNSDKFVIGTSKGANNGSVCIDENGYYVVTTTAPSNAEASVASNYNSNNYFYYSTVNTDGMYYEDVYDALEGNKKGTVTVFTDELDLTNSSFEGTIVVPEGEQIKIIVEDGMTPVWTVTAAEGAVTYTDAAGNELVKNDNGSFGAPVVPPKGNDFTGYTSDDRIWGEVWGNAKESFVIKVLDANGNVMGTTSLNNVGGIINGNVNVTWSLLLDAESNADEFWTMEWTTAPTIDNQPAKVELWVDGVKVSGGDVVLNGPDNLNMIYAAEVDADGKITGYCTLDTFVSKVGDLKDRRILVLRDVSFSSTEIRCVEFISGVEGGVTVTNTDAENWIDFDFVTIGKGVTVNVENPYSGDSDNVIEGTLVAGDTYYHGYDAKTTVLNGGKVKVGGTTILRYNEKAGSGIYIYGDGVDATVEFDCDYYIGAYSGTFYAENANIETGYFLLKNSYDNSSYADIDMTLDSSSLTVVGTTDTQDSFIIDDQAHLTLKNGSSIKDVRDFNILTGANLSLSVDSSSSISATYMNIAEDVPFEAVENADGTFGVAKKEGLSGSGTEEDPYLINNIDDLKWFRDKVDNVQSDRSNQFLGKYVKLTDDIDMAGINWNPIGEKKDHGSFMGIFDGGDHTISNLYVEQAGEYLGLFAYTGSFSESEQAVIKNLTLHNVTVKSTNNSNYVGGLVGNATTTNFENIHVTGTVEISGRGYIGGIVGHGYSDFDNVSVKATNGTISSTFWCAGGVIGYLGEGSTIKNAVVEGLTIKSAAGGLGSIVGMASSNEGTQPCTGENLSAKNVAIQTYTGAYGDSYAEYSLGYLIGGDTSVMTGSNTVENVTFACSNGTTNPDVSDAVASIGNAIYFDLQSALDAAAAGTGNVTVEILRDVDLTGIDWNPVTVSASGYPVVTVNGNDHAITGLNDMLFAGTWAGKSGLIINDLTIKDSNIVNDKDDAEGTVGVGAFIGFPQASATITLNNCHLVNSSVEGGHWTGGLIGYAAGYAGNDGPVFMNLTIKDCSVTDSIITGKGSVGGIIGHGSGNGWTNVVIENTTVSDNTITSTGSSNVKAGAVMGTIGAAGQPTTANGVTLTGGASVSATVSGNTVKSNGTTITTIYGRQGTNTGMLYVSGGSYDNYPIEKNVAYAAPKAGYAIAENTDGTYGIVVDPAYGKAAKIGEEYYETLDAAFAAAQPGNEVKILMAGTYALTTSGKNITITGAVDGVVFDNIGAKNMGSANVTFNNVTFDYYPNVNYTGLQHSGNLVYNNCTINGQVFLYGESETFKNCTFNQNSADAYNVWTYGAKEVAFNECTFNSVGKSVLIYAEGAGIFNDVTVTDCDFIASAPVDGKAAIEMDSSLTAGINLTIDAATTATGFGSGNVSGNSLWNNKKGNSTDANNDITVKVGDETVLAPVTFVAQIGDVKYEFLHDAMTTCKAGETVTLIADVDLAGTVWEPVAFKGTFDGQDHTISNLVVNKPGVSNTGFITSLNGTFKNVTFTNPTVTGGENTGVVAGRAGGSAALAENITVNGTIKVETTHSGYARAAAIVGGWAYGNYKNITVDGGDKAVSYIKHTGGGDGRYVAGIVGHADDVESYVNCTVKNITISGGWLCGGIAGPGPSDGLATGCAVENVNMGADYSGGMFGWYYGSGTIKNSSIKNVTFTDGSTNNGAIGGYSANEDATVTNVTIENVKNADGAPLLDHVAKVNGIGYISLQAAIEAAKDGDVIKVLANIDLSKTELQVLDGSYDTYFLVEGKSVTIDLNGKTISGAYTGTKTMLVGVFSTNENGHLTLTGNGTVDVTATNKVYCLISNYNPGCSITIKNGTYKLDKAADCLIHTAASANEGEGNEGVIVNGGTFTLGNVGTGKNGQPWIFNANGSGERHVWVTGGTYNADVFHQYYAWEVQYPDAKSAIKDNGDGTWTVVDAVAYIGRDLDGYTRKTGYETIKDAIYAAQPGETVTILAGSYTADLTVNKAITVVGETDAEGNNLVNITGRVTVNTGATVKNLNVHNDTTGEYACALNISGKDIVIDGCELSGYNAVKYSYATGNVTFQNSKLTGTEWAIHFDGSTGGNVVVDNCEVNGWIAFAGSLDKVTLKDSEFTSGKYAGGRTYNKNVEITGCEFEAGYKFDLASADTNVTVADTTVGGESAVNLFNSDDLCGQNTVVIDGEPVAHYVAMIGSVYYTTLEEAIANVADWTTIKLVADATLDYNAREAYGRATTTDIIIDGQGYTLTLNQKDSDWSSIGMANADGKLTLKNMTIEKTGYGDTSGAWNTHAIIFSCNVEMNNVTVNNSVAVQNGATLKNVAINEANDYYGLWINGNGQTVTVEGGEINATNGRGIKIADQYVGTPASVTLNVTGTKFNTAKKAAVLVSSTAGAAITASNVDITKVVADPVNFVWVDEDWAANYGEVTVTGATKGQESIEKFSAVVESAGKIIGYYKSLQAAIDACVAGDNTITLLVDCDEDVTIKQVEGVNITIDGAQNVYSGTITIHGNARYTGEETLTIQNVKFETSEAGHYFIDSNSTGSVERYAHNVTVKDSSFTATGEAVKSAAAMRIRQGFNIAMENVTATGMHSLFQGYGCAGFTANKVTVNGKNGISVGTSTNVKITEANITATGYGVRADGTGAYDMTVTASTINAELPIVVRNATGAYSLTTSGNTLAATNTEGYQVIFTSGDDGTYVAPTGAYEYTGDEALKVFPEPAVAKIGETGYPTLAKAIEAAQSGETIVLLADITEDVTVNKDLTIDGAGKTYTGNISVSGSTTDVTVKNVNFVNGTGYAITTNRIKSITVENCTVTNYGYGFLYANKSTPTVVVKDVTVEGGNYGFHWVYGTSATLENVKMTDVYYGLYIQNYAGKTITLKNCDISSISIWERSGYSGVQTFKFEGANTVGTLSSSQYAKYVLAAADATLTAPEGATVTTSVEGCMVKYVDGVYKVVPAVAKIGDVYYETVAEALAAAKDGDTVELISGENVISMAGSVTGDKTVIITGTAVVDWTKGNLFIGREGEGNGKVIFDGATITSSVKKTVASTGIHVSGGKASDAKTNYGVLEIKNSNIELDYLINRNETIVDDNSTLTIYGGIYTHGRDASESVSGTDETATLTIGAGSTVNVINENGMGVGGEGKGIMTVNGTYKANVLNVSAKGIVNISGTVEIAGNVKNNGTVALTDVDASMAAKEGLTVTTNVDGYEVNYADGKYTLAKVELFKLAGANVKIDSSLTMFFYVPKAELESGVDYYATITKANAGEDATVVEVPMIEWESYSSSLYRVAFDDLMAYMMNDEIKVQIFSADGTAVSEVWTDSVSNYAYRIYDNQNDKYKTALVDMLNYGAACQTFFGYDTENLANQNLTEDQKNMASSDPSLTDSRVKGENYYGSSLTCDSTLILQFYFTNINENMTAKITYTNAYGRQVTETIAGSDFNKCTESLTGVKVGLAAYDAQQLVTCEVYDGDVLVASASDSVESYVARMSSSNDVYITIMKFALSSKAALTN